MASEHSSTVTLPRVLFRSHRQLWLLDGAGDPYDLRTGFKKIGCDVRQTAPHDLLLSSDGNVAEDGQILSSAHREAEQRNS